MPGRTSLRSSPRWHLSPNDSILSATFITSWRGQLLICTACLALGIVYYYVRRPVSAILRSRREAVSRAMQAELMSLEVDDKEVAQTTSTSEKSKEGTAAKGKDKRKDVKKRKGSLLKVNVPSTSASGATSATESNLSAAGPSSRETSPAPARLAVPTPTPKGRSKTSGGGGSNKASGSRRDRSISPSSPSPSPSPSPKPQIRIRHPTSDEVDRLPTIPSSGESPITPTSKAESEFGDQRGPQTANVGAESTLLVGRRDNHLQGALNDPLDIPLPSSPCMEDESGPSRRSKPASSNGDISDSTTYSSSALSAAPPVSASHGKPTSRQPTAWQADGFSIVPDASYLPPSTLASVMSKRKKKKDRQSNLPDIFDTDLTHSSDNLSRYSQPTSVDNESIATPNSPPQRPIYRGHSRKASLKMVRPPANASAEELEEYFHERDHTVDSLRAEVGEAKAQEAKARDAEQRAKDAETRARKELDLARKRAAGDTEEQNRIILETLKAYEELYTKTAGMREAAAQWAEVKRAREGSNAPDTQIPPMPAHPPHIIEMLGRQGPINNGVWINPSPAPSTPGQPPTTPNQARHRRPTMPMSTSSYLSPAPHQNGFQPPHSPFPASPNARTNGFLTPAHPPPPCMGHPYIGPGASPHFAPQLSHPPTPQAMFPHSPHLGMFPHTHPHGPVPNGIGHDSLYIPANGFRRVSDGSSFAGPLTPGIPSSAPSPLPVQIGLGFPVSAPAPSHANGHITQEGSSAESMSAERRVSIEATVMKKKAAAAASTVSDEPSITEMEEGVDQEPVNHGLGLGDVGIDASNGGPTPTSASASSFDPTSSPELAGATSMSRTSSTSCPSSPDHTSHNASSLELNKAVIDSHAESMKSGVYGLCNDTDVVNLKASITEPLTLAKSESNGTDADSRQLEYENGVIPNGVDESFIPYFPTLACSREENERNQQGLKAEAI